MVRTTHIRVLELLVHILYASTGTHNIFLLIYIFKVSACFIAAPLTPWAASSHPHCTSYAAFMVRLAQNIPWATGRNICYQTLSLHPWGFWESLARLKKDRCACDECVCALLLSAACEENERRTAGMSSLYRNDFPNAFNTSQYQISTRREVTRGEVLKYLIFEGVWGHWGNTSCVVCWQNGSVSFPMKLSHSAGQLNTRTASQAAFFSKPTDGQRLRNMCPITSCTLLRKHVQPPPFQTHSCIALKIDTFKHWGLGRHLWVVWSQHLS